MSRQALKISKEYWCGKPRLLALLAETARSRRYERTFYLTPELLESYKSVGLRFPLDCASAVLEDIIEEIPDTETGLVVFMAGREAIVVVPPFPIKTNKSTVGLETTSLMELLSSHPIVGVLLLRMGRYALGVINGEKLIASKTASRYVKPRHRAGGSSQRRFERSRERLVRELFDKTCVVAKDLFSQYSNKIDYILLGGERHTLRNFVKRCSYIREFDGRILSRLLYIDRPDQATLEKISFEVWKSKVVVFSNNPY